MQYNGADARVTHADVSDTEGTIVLQDEYSRRLSDLDGCSHVVA
ncbi:hypothetical protein [Halorientalis salina]|nr:hypothetical protein [Halorientalis salina]